MSKIYILLMGPPGAGKGTQAAKLAEQYSIPHISTGDIFRAAVKAGTEMGKEAKKHMDAGQLVPDTVTIGIVKERLSQADCRKGFILDGFPRTVEQANALEGILSGLSVKLGRVININVPSEELVRRTTGRRICKGCPGTYHILFNPPKAEGRCDNCNGELYQRDDDREETVTKRLTVYTLQTQPLIEYYQNHGLYTKIDGSRGIDVIFLDIIASLKGQVL